MCGFIAQLVEHRTGIAEATGSNPVEALIFFRLLLSNCLNWKICCEDHSSLSVPESVGCNQRPQLVKKGFFSIFSERIGCVSCRNKFSSDVCDSILYT